jgi:hypothetical protein
MFHGRMGEDLELATLLREHESELKAIATPAPSGDPAEDDRRDGDGGQRVTRSSSTTRLAAAIVTEPPRTR